MKKLTKINEGKKIAGVCTGLSAYANMDVTVVRLLVVLFTIFAGSGILFYILAAIIMPDEEPPVL